MTYSNSNVENTCDIHRYTYKVDVTNFFNITLHATATFF